MILLTATTHTLELVTSSTSAIDYLICYADITSTTFTPGDNQGAITSATTTTVLAAPAASTQRQIKFISIANKGVSDNIITLQKDVSATNYEVVSGITLGADELFVYVDGRGFTTYNADGSIKAAPATLADADYGDITVSSTGSVLTIDAGAVTLAKMADMATASIIGRNTAGTGAPEVLSATTTKSLLSLSNVENTALSTWAGTSNITTLGTIATGVWSGTDVAVADGGTGRSTSTAYAVVCGGTTSTAAHQSIASVGTSGHVLTSAGAGALPTFAPPGVVAISAKGPASTQSINTGTYTKLQISVVVSDPYGYFDNVTNYRATPLVAGTYFVAGSVLYNTSVDQTSVAVDCLKNGSTHSPYAETLSSGTGFQTISIFGMQTFNGSTDYVELYAYQASGGSVNVNLEYCNLVLFRISA